MKALILAAGRGSRMKEFTSNKPKCLLKIKNISLIERQINNFKKQGINDIGIIKETMRPRSGKLSIKM